MIIRDESGNSFTTDREDIAEREIWNDNKATTIGGRVKSQADSTHLQIDCELLLTNAEYITLKAILENFGDELFYTPNRILFGRSTAEEMKVVASVPKIKSRASGKTIGGDIAYIFTLQLEEVID